MTLRHFQYCFIVYHKNKINVAPAKMRSVKGLGIHMERMFNIKIVHNKWTHIIICNYQYMAHLNYSFFASGLKLLIPTLLFKLHYFDIIQYPEYTH